MSNPKINVLFKRNPPRTQINRSLSRNKHDNFAQTNNATTHQDIFRFYKELDEALAILDEKYSSQPPNKRRRIQRLVWTRGMVVNALQRIHLKICRRLRSSPTLATPWRGDFTMDIPTQVFSVIFEEIIKHNGYGHESNETAACIEVNVTEKKKALFIFHHINT